MQSNHIWCKESVPALPDLVKLVSGGFRDTRLHIDKFPLTSIYPRNEKQWNQLKYKIYIYIAYIYSIYILYIAGYILSLLIPAFSHVIFPSHFPNPSSPAHISKEPPVGIWEYADLGPVVAFVESAIAQGKLKRDPLIPVQVAPSKEVFDRVMASWGGSF